MNIKHVQTLMYNPFYLSKIIQCFLTGYKNPVDLRTIFFVLPIIMYSDARNRLNHTSSRSTVLSVFSNDDIYEEYGGVKLKSEFCLNQIAQLYDEYKEITKNSIIFLKNQSCIDINKEVILLKNLDYNKVPHSIKEYFKAAHYLGVILNKISLIEFIDYLNLEIIDR